MKTKAVAVAGLVVWGLFSGIVVRAEEDNSIRVIKQALLGAGVGAISSEVSGGKAGTGALVGAGTNVVGSALAELLTNGGGNRGGYTVVQPQGYTQVQPFQFYQYQESAVSNYSHNAQSSGFSTGVYPAWPVANQTVVQTTTTTTAPVCQPVPQPRYNKWGPRGNHRRAGSRQLQRVYDYQGRLISEYETWR